MLQRRVNNKRGYYYVFGKCENSGESGELGESWHQAPDSEAITASCPLTHNPVNASESSESVELISSSADLVTPLAHQVKDASESIRLFQYPDLEAVSGTGSLDSSDSPLKTDLGDSIYEKSLKVGDRVQLLAKTHERSGQTGIIKYFSGWFAAIAWADGSIDISHKTDNLELAEVAK